MAGYADVYALAPARDRGTLNRFLAQFAPRREESADEYEVPQYADQPQAVYRQVDGLLAHLFATPTEPHAVYWRTTGGSGPDHAMAFFTADGAMIVGVSCDPADDGRWLGELLAFAGTGVGYISYESPPPDTETEFRAVATARTNSSS